MRDVARYGQQFRVGHVLGNRRRGCFGQFSPVLVLQWFGGGCQGCGMVDATLKGGVEKTLLEQLPQLAGVKDITDHSDRSHAYY